MTYRDALIAKERAEAYMEGRLQQAETERQLRRLRPQRERRAWQWLRGLPGKVGSLLLAVRRRLAGDGAVEATEVRGKASAG